jgi:hypothetical protein
MRTGSEFLHLYIHAQGVQEPILLFDGDLEVGVAGEAAEVEAARLGDR